MSTPGVKSDSNVRLEFDIVWDTCLVGTIGPDMRVGELKINIVKFRTCIGYFLLQV